MRSQKYLISYAGWQGRKSTCIADIVPWSGESELVVLLTDPPDNPGDSLFRSVCSAAGVVYWTFLRDYNPTKITWMSYFPVGQRYSTEFLKMARFDKTIMIGVAQDGSMSVLPQINTSVVPYRLTRMRWSGEWYSDPYAEFPSYDLVKRINQRKSSVMRRWPYQQGDGAGSISARIYFQGGIAATGLHPAWFRLETRMLLENKLIVKLSQERNYYGTSITNLFEYAASHAYWNYLTEYSPDNLVFIEQYDDGEALTKVELDWDRETLRFCNPRWEPVSSSLCEVLSKRG
jgi:hypothetical protein